MPRQPSGACRGLLGSVSVRGGQTSDESTPRGCAVLGQRLLRRYPHRHPIVLLFRKSNIGQAALSDALEVRLEFAPTRRLPICGLPSQASLRRRRRIAVRQRANLNPRPCFLKEEGRLKAKSVALSKGWNRAILYEIPPPKTRGGVKLVCRFILKPHLSMGLPLWSAGVFGRMALVTFGISHSSSHIRPKEHPPVFTISSTFMIIVLISLLMS
jgi:hypothetical protein